MLWHWVGERLRSRFRAPVQEGNILVLSAFMMVVVLGLAGLATDVGYEMDRFREAQNIADSLALAGAKAVSLDANLSSMTAVQSDVTSKVSLAFQVSGYGSASYTLSYLDSSKQSHDITWYSDPTSIKYVRADVKDSFPTFFIRVLGLTGNTVGTHAVAQVQWTPECELCVMDQTASGALSLGGGGGFSGTNIRIIDNSNSSDALDASGSASLNDSGTDATIYTVGTGPGYVISGGAVVNPTVQTGIQPIPDPLSWEPLPSKLTAPFDLVGSCYAWTKNSGGWTSSGNSGPCDNKTPPNVTPSGSQSVILNPGVYGSIKDTATNGIVYLKPGIYVITGEFSAQAQSVITTCTPGTSVGTICTTDGGESFGSSCSSSAPSNCNTGVMIYLTCPSTSGPYYYTACTSGTSYNKNSAGYISFAGGATINLSAPTSYQQSCTNYPTTNCPTLSTYNPSSSNGANDAYLAGYVPWQYTGLLIFQDRNDNNSMSLEGSSSSAPPTTSCLAASTTSSCISGTIYGYDAPISISGGGSQQTALMSYVIADTVTFTGNGGTSGSQTFDMTFPQGLNAPLSVIDGLVE